MVETEPAKEVKIKKRPVSISDIHPLWTNIQMSAVMKII